MNTEPRCAQDDAEQISSQLLSIKINLMSYVWRWEYFIDLHQRISDDFS